MLVQQNVQMGFVAESIRRIVGCGDSTHRCRRRRHKVFAKIYSIDRSGELRSPAFEVCIGVTEPVFLFICVAFYPDKSLPQCYITIHYI